MTKIAATVYLLIACIAVGARADDKPNGGLPERVATHHAIRLVGALHQDVPGRAS